MAKTQKQSLGKDTRLRRTRLYIPGNNPAMIQNAAVYGADSLIFDLEDSIPITEKDSARDLVKYALKTLNFELCEVTVRINGIETNYFLEDLEAIIPTQLEGVLLPKTETIEDVITLASEIERIEKKNNIPIGKTKIMPIIESAIGVLNIEEISAGPRVVTIGLGGEDLTADIGAKRTKEGKELEYISSKIVLACAANKIQAIDTVYADFNDPEGLYRASLKAIEMGFQGKSIIHPSQIEPVHRAFMPSENEIDNAKKILKAYKESLKKGSGAITVNGRMIDLPVVIRAKQILNRANLQVEEKKEKMKDEI